MCIGECVGLCTYGCLAQLASLGESKKRKCVMTMTRRPVSDPKIFYLFIFFAKLSWHLTNLAFGSVFFFIVVFFLSVTVVILHCTVKLKQLEE